MNHKFMHFGEHVTIDGYGGDEAKLASRELVLEALNELPEKLDMKKLSTPEVYFAQGNDGKDPGGWSGFVVIEESHISIHNFPQRGFLTADVYTCQNGLDRDTIREYFREKFDLKEIEENFIVRGTRYPKENQSS